MRALAPTLSPLLQKVSRSFGLSIRLLPAALREPVGVAYLLARISDTVADSASAPVAQRLALLDQLAQCWPATGPGGEAIEPSAHGTPGASGAPNERGQAPSHTPSRTPPEAQSDIQSDIQSDALSLALREFATQVSDPHERTLLAQSQACLQALARLRPQDQRLIREVLAAITEGQRWDLTALDATGHGVRSEQDVERYTWWVAGSVGEFWTRLCEAHLQHWHRASSADMLQWAAHYGQGLQRLNILRDAGRDLRAGRCYFPAEALAPLGLDAATLCAAARSEDLATLSRLTPLLQAWHHQTEQDLHAGLRYSLALRGRRLRLASALPGLIGVRTLALLRQAGVQALVQHHKLPRRGLHRLLAALLLGGVSDRQLQASWQSGLGSTAPSPLSARIGP